MTYIAGKCVDRSTLWALHYLKPLPFYVTARVALLGDAVSVRSRYQLNTSLIFD